MKNFFVVLAIFTLTFMGCPTGLDNAEIGTIGPGGGTVFYAEGNQYKECSGELGNNTWSEAKTVAKNYRGGGFSNWHLPTRNELDLMYKNLKKNRLGGFSNGRYWASEDNSYDEYYQSFFSGKQGDGYSSDLYGVRAVRSYSKDAVTVTDKTALKIKNESSVSIANVVWQGVTFAESNTSITSGSLVTKTVQPGSGYIYFRRTTNPINARTRDWIVVEKDKQKEFVFMNDTVIVDVGNPDNTGTLGALQPKLTTLKIKNESFTEITDVIWQDVSFANNQYENSIKIGTTVTNTVQAGGGYIFFKRKSNPISARTNDIVIIAQYENKEFTFTDDTDIVEVGNTNNSGTLGTLQNTVVWWDDAEGELQPYYESRSFVGYYAIQADLFSGNTYYTNYFYPPKNGSKSIAIGGTITAMLHLKVNLSRKAKLSFWYANRYGNSAGAVFSINSEEERQWTTDINWSFMEFDLEPGINDLIWEKKDGYLYSGTSPYYRSFYLSLDDILIYYTE